MQYIAFTLLTLRDKLVSSEKERGATIVEYALVLAAISLVLLIGAATMTGAVSTLWTSISTKLVAPTT